MCSPLPRPTSREGSVRGAGEGGAGLARITVRPETQVRRLL